MITHFIAFYFLMRPQSKMARAVTRNVVAT
jgi:hypothetical protein